MGDVRNAALQRMHIACALLGVGRFAEGVQRLDESIAAGEAMGLSHFVATARHNRALALARLGRIDEGMREERLAIAEFEALGDRRLLAASRADLGRMHTMALDFEAGEREARAVLSDPEPVPTALVLARTVLADALLGHGRGALGGAGVARDARGEDLGARPAGELLERRSRERAAGGARGAARNSRRLRADRAAETPLAALTTGEPTRRAS